MKHRQASAREWMWAATVGLPATFGIFWYAFDSWSQALACTSATATVMHAEWKKHGAKKR